MQKQWSCGCMEVDGQLVDECSQVKPAEQLQSHQRSVYSPVCYRKVQDLPDALPVYDAGGEFAGYKVPTPEATDGVQE